MRAGYLTNSRSGWSGMEACVGARVPKTLGQKSVAKGVERMEDWDILKQRGCDLAPDYFIAKPMPDQDLPDWARS
jgi:EAL domain-containing protein (putative c-di-GMP-specific phosphodiesterase class I)